MLDLEFIRQNAELVETKSRQKGYRIDVDELLKLDAKTREQLSEIDKLRQTRNELASRFGKSKPTASQLEEGRKIKDKLTTKEKSYEKNREHLEEVLKTVPNMPLDDVPVGESEAENKVAKKVGTIKEFDFKPRNHWELAEPKGWIDKERAAKVAGSRFAYIKGDLVLLQQAIIGFVMKTLTDERIIEKIIADNHLDLPAKPFIPVLPPAIIRTKAYEPTGRLDAAEVTYKLENDDLWLNASAEHSLCNMYMNEILDESLLPLRYVGLLTSFRREAGSYGKDMEGIFRMHQFDKMEMEVFSTPESGLNEHLLLIAIQEYLVQQLELPYQVLMKCTADIGKPNARGVDIEIWLPGQDKYRETHTADYMTDYQARRLKTRFRRGADIALVHTNDATAFALGRTMIAIMENNQTADGHVIIPEVLRQFMAGKEQL